MGLTDKISGRVKQAAGDLTGDDKLQKQGRREERKDEAERELAEANEKQRRKAEELANLERKT
jgi:uncharacterized protein YjbJ (UPF0337 family)